MDLIKILDFNKNKKIIINNRYIFEIEVEEIDKTQAFNKTELVNIILKKIRNDKKALNFIKDKEFKKVNIIM